MHEEDKCYYTNVLYVRKNMRIIRNTRGIVVDWQLNQTVIVQKRTNTVNQIGNAIPTWSTRATIKAALRTMNAYEQAKLNKELFTVTHVLYTRNNEIQADDRVSYDSQLYLVKSIENKFVGYPGAHGHYKAMLERIDVRK